MMLAEAAAAVWPTHTTCLVPRPRPKIRASAAQNLGMHKACTACSIVARFLARFPRQHAPFFSLETHAQHPQGRRQN